MILCLLPLPSFFYFLPPSPGLYLRFEDHIPEKIETFWFLSSLHPWHFTWHQPLPTLLSSVVHIHATRPVPMAAIMSHPCVQSADLPAICANAAETRPSPVTQCYIFDTNVFRFSKSKAAYILNWFLLNIFEHETTVNILGTWVIRMTMWASLFINFSWLCGSISPSLINYFIGDDERSICPDHCPLVHF